MTNLIFSLGSSESNIDSGKVKALIFICLVVFVMTFLKNTF